MLYEAQSPDRRFIVSQDGDGLRYLQFEWEGPYQSVVGPGFPLRLELPYARAVAAALAFVVEPRRLLVVGVGGGSLPMFLRAVLPRAHIDAVDCDAEMVDAARRFFGFREDAALRAHVADGRRFIEASGPPYDVIILDAYGPHGIPRPLATREFFLAARARLATDGAVVSNITRAPNPLFASMVRTFQASFAQLYAFDVRETSNFILVGLDHARPFARAALKARAERLTRAWRIPFSLRALVARRYEDWMVGDPASVLTDSEG